MEWCQESFMVLFHLSCVLWLNTLSLKVLMRRSTCFDSLLLLLPAELVAELQILPRSNDLDSPNQHSPKPKKGSRVWSHIRGRTGSALVQQAVSSGQVKVSSSCQDSDRLFCLIRLVLTQGFRQERNQWLDVSSSKRKPGIHQSC